MATIVYAVLLVILVLWAVLLGLAVRKRRYCPHFVNPLTTKLFWLFTFLFINPLLMLLYAVFGLFRGPDRRPIPLVVLIAVVIILAGFAVNIPGVTHIWMQPFIARNADPDASLKARAAAIESRNSTSHSTSSAASDNSRLALGHIEIATGEHPLLRTVAARLAEKLRGYAGVQEVSVWPAGSPPDEDILHPDVFICLDLKRFRENHVPYLLTLDVELNATVSPELFPSRNHHFGHYSPPLLRFDMDINIDHSSKTVGYESQRYGLAGENLAKQLYDQITAQTDEWRQKHGLLPDLPAAVYGEHRPAALPEEFTGFEPDRLHSAAGLLLHRRAVWELSLADATASESMEKLHQELLDAGWTSDSAHFDEQTAYFRVHQGPRVIAAHKVRQEQDAPSPGLTQTVSAPDGMPVPDQMRQSPPQPRESADRVIVHDALRFSDAELEQALDAVLAEKDPGKAMLFERMYTPEQKERMIALLEASPEKGAEEWVELAEHYSDSDPDRARQALLWAHAVSWADGINAPAADHVKRAAKGLKMEDLIKEPPSPETLIEAGFREITPDTEDFTAHYQIGERARFFTRTDAGPQAFTIYPQPHPGKEAGYEFVHLTRDRHSSGRGSRGGWRSGDGNTWKSSSTAFYGSHPDRGVKMTCTVEVDPDSDQYTVHCDIMNEAPTEGGA